MRVTCCIRPDFAAAEAARFILSEERTFLRMVEPAPEATPEAMLAW